MRVRKGNLPLIHLGGITPDWIKTNGFLAFGIQLQLALDLNPIRGQCNQSMEVRVGRTYVNKRKKRVLPFLKEDRSIEIFNDLKLEQICQALNVNCVILARFKSMVKEVFTYGTSSNRETVFFHVDERKYNNGDLTSLALIFDKKESVGTNLR